MTESPSPQPQKRHQASVITIDRLSIHHPFGAIMIPKAVHGPRSSMDAKVKQKFHFVTDNSTNRRGVPSYPIQEELGCRSETRGSLSNPATLADEKAPISFLTTL